MYPAAKQPRRGTSGCLAARSGASIRRIRGRRRWRAQKDVRWHVAVKGEQLKSAEGLTHHCSALPSLHRAADTGGWQTRSIRSVMPTRSWKRGIAARKVRTHRHHTPRHQVRHRPDTPALVATNTATTPPRHRPARLARHPLPSQPPQAISVRADASSSFTGKPRKVSPSPTTVGPGDPQQRLQQRACAAASAAACAAARAGGAGRRGFLFPIIRKPPFGSQPGVMD